MPRSIYRRYRVLKKNPWIVALSLAAFVLSPALQAAAAKETAAPATADKAPAASDKAAAASDAAAAKSDQPAAADKDQAPSVGHKSPALAGGLAFFPGFLVHGAGHMYAGSWMKGLGLLTIEGVSTVVVANSVIDGRDDIKAIADGVSNHNIPTNLSGGYTKVGIILVGTMAFLWTWFDDMAGAPVAANEYNHLADEKSQTTLRLEPNSNGVQVALSTHF
jgi:hypothetical protein